VSRPVPVSVGGQPANGYLVEVLGPGAHGVLQSDRTTNGLATFKLPEGGTYEVRVYPDPNAFGEPLIESVVVQ